jgi:hypothetical protein
VNNPGVLPPPTNIPESSPLAGAQAIFYEYIQGRARITGVVALVLFVTALFGLIWLAAGRSVQIYQLGLLLQMTGAAALFPLVLPRQPQQPAAANTPMENGWTAADLSAPADFVAYYQERSLPLVVGNLAAALALIMLVAELVFAAPGSIAWEEGLLRVLFALLGFVWINYYMLIHIYLQFQWRISRPLLFWFFFVDLILSVVGVFFAAIVHILIHWIPWGLRSIYQNGFKRVLLIVTLPFWFVGLVFELIATL